MNASDVPEIERALDSVLGALIAHRKQARAAAGLSAPPTPSPQTPEPAAVVRSRNHRVARQGSCRCVFASFGPLARNKTGRGWRRRSDEGDDGDGRESGRRPIRRSDHDLQRALERRERLACASAVPEMKLVAIALAGLGFALITRANALPGIDPAKACRSVATVTGAFDQRLYDTCLLRQQSASKTIAALGPAVSQHIRARCRNRRESDDGLAKCLKQDALSMVRHLHFKF